MNFELMKELGLYDYLLHKGYELNKDDIIDFFKEFNHAVHEIDEKLEKEALDKAIKSYKERYL